MLMKEGDARGMKQCPRADLDLCIGSDCFVWNWDKSVKKATKMTTANKSTFPGYCGFAGEPLSEYIMPKGI